MADAASSAFLQVVFQTALNFIIEELKLEHDLQKEIEDLKMNVEMINDTLNEAEKFNQPPRLKRWLNELRDVGYKAIDLLDDHNTELQRRMSIHFAELRNKVSIFNFKRRYYRHKMSNKIKEVSDEMDRALQRRVKFGLNVNEYSSVRGRFEITASLPPTHIVGRENEKNEIIEKLISCNDVQVRKSMLNLNISNKPVTVREPNVIILAIHGMGRIGKTSLAQLIYNDKKISMHFDMRLWVHVSCEFDLEKVTLSILDSIGELSYHGLNLDTPQRRIQSKLQGKRFLLVLDDFWNENLDEWEKLIRPLYTGAPGSVIIVTTRTRLIAEMVSTFPSVHLKQLSDHDCFSLVSQYAFRSDNRYGAMLYELRNKIVESCRGIPEEAINLGYQLRREDNREKWKEIVVGWGEGRTFPEERNVFIDSMRLSYSRLPLILKPHLAYCSIIPSKGFQFEKEWIVQLWMAQSFIANQNEQRIEDIGNTYFDWFVERSYFQRTKNDVNSDQYKYSIPDLVHEIARCASVQECCIFELGKPHNLTSTTKHMSILFTKERFSCTKDTFSEISQCKGLYTLLIIGGYLINHPLQFPDDIFKSLERLRTLDLSYCNLASNKKKLVSLPTSIECLKHLRYLQLRNSNIQELPESVCNLYNLQTLGLRNCFLLKKLPNEIRLLRKLRHLDLHLDLPPNVDQTTPSHEILKSMPPNIGQLSNLQVLSRFVVSKTMHCGIDELRNLNNLQGELLISNLNLVNPDDAANSNMHEKMYIERLSFHWMRDRGFFESSQERTRAELVLKNLMPSSTIKKLSITGYTGDKFPYWLGSSDLSKLQLLFLSDCSNCTVLPPLGNLPLLENLHIKGMPSLTSIDCKFCGSNGNRFPSLKKVVLEDMTSLKKWTGDDNCQLVHLCELVIKGCTSLQRLTHNFFSLANLTIEKSPEFIGLRRYSSLRYLKVIDCGDWIWDSWPCLSKLFSLTLSQLSSETLPNLPKIFEHLRSLEISYCNNLTMIPDDWIPSVVISLCIRQCPKLSQLPKGLETHKILEDLEIQGCENLEFLPELKNLKSLTRLEISNCDSFVFLPSEGLPHALHFLSISECPLFSKQFQDSQSQDRIKIQRVSSAWIDHKHFTYTPGPESSSSSTSRR